jgi:broad specificity phosphatase PhoE
MFSCIVFLMVSCKTTTYYVVRHAEKETSNTMASDVPLSEAGRQRAIALKELLQNESIQHIYSTDFLRTRQTAQPLADAKNISI